MKLYRLGEGGLRIRLSREDLDAYSMSVDDLDYETKRGKYVLREIFDRAKEETGFDVSREKIYVQLYPTSSGGCELYVTKLEDETPKDCFLFQNFDLFFAAEKHVKDPHRAYRAKKSDHFYLLLPRKSTPAVLYEFGERVKCPSPLFFKYKCHEVHRKDVPS